MSELTNQLDTMRMMLTNVKDEKLQKVEKIRVNAESKEERLKLCERIEKELL